MDNEFKQYYKILIYAFESHPSFGLSSKYLWPYSDDDACDLISHGFALTSSKSQEIIDWVEDTLEVNNNFRLDRLTPKELTPDSTNLFDQVIYNKDNLIIKSWSSSIIVTSAIFYLVRSELHRWKTSCDRIQTSSGNYSGVEYTICPVAFSWPVKWSELLGLSTDPFVGPELSLALKDLFPIRHPGISVRIIYCLINSYIAIPYDQSFLRQGLTNYLHIFDIDQVTILALTDKVGTSESFKPLIIFLTNYKLKGYKFKKNI